MKKKLNRSTATLKDAVDASKKASARIATWPKWKRDAIGREKPENCPWCSGESFIVEYEDACRIGCTRGCIYGSLGDTLERAIVYWNHKVFCIRKKQELEDRAIRFDLDKAGIKQREKEAVELVELRAENAELKRALNKVAKGEGE